MSTRNINSFWFVGGIIILVLGMTHGWTMMTMMMIPTKLLKGRVISFEPWNHQHHQKSRRHDFLSIMRQTTLTTIICSSSFHSEESSQSHSRWVGSFQRPIRHLSEITKSKRHVIQVIVGNDTYNTDETITNTSIDINQRNGSENTKQLILEKKKYESLQHVLVKAFIVHLFFQKYTHLEIEQDIGDPRYYPDVVSYVRRPNDSQIVEQDLQEPPNIHCKTHHPLFWGESGRMSLEKACDLGIRYPNTHIVWIRWGISLEEFSAQVVPALKQALKTTSRTAQYTLGVIPHRHLWDYVDPNDHRIHIRHEDVQWLELVENLAE
jgi:hypothetical protein